MPWRGPQLNTDFMSLTTGQCAAFNDLLGRRPYNWEKKIAKDRKPTDYIYTAMYVQKPWPPFTGTTHMHERVYVARPNDPNLWDQFQADACVGTPCDTTRNYLAHGVDQLRFDEYGRDYQTPVFCLDQLNTVEEGIAKIAAIAEGYQELPELISSNFLRTLCLQKAGTQAQGGGLYLAGAQDINNNPVILDVTSNMFSRSQGQSLVKSTNSLLINIGPQLSAQGVTATTAGLAAAIGSLTMEFLGSLQEQLAANGYTNKEWLPSGKFSVTTDLTTRRKLLVANPALTQMYSAADFAKGGAFYSYGVSNGCGDWLFKEDKQQMRFRFRADMDGKDFSGTASTNAVWIEQVWPFENVAATFGIKPVFSRAWLNAPLRLFHVYNREARQVYVGDITSVNPEMKFGMARSFMGKWTWKSPDYFQAVDPNTGTLCSYQNDKHNKGYWLGEYRFGVETIFPEIECWILGLGENTPFTRVPRTNTAPTSPINTTDYQSLLAYAAACNWGPADPNSSSYVPPGWNFSLPVED